MNASGPRQPAPMARTAARIAAIEPEVVLPVANLILRVLHADEPSLELNTVHLLLALLLDC
jgi:hypothetical protein